jgi:hypothetical protein
MGTSSRDLCKTPLWAPFRCQAKILVLKIPECIPACLVECRAYFYGVIKMFTLTQGFHAPHPYGQLDCCPILQSCRIALELEKAIYFSFGYYIGDGEKFEFIKPVIGYYKKNKTSTSFSRSI